MFGAIRAEFKCLKGYGQNSNVWKDKLRILMFEKTGSEFQSLDT